jgi:hypothetical protein
MHRRSASVPQATPPRTARSKPQVLSKTPGARAAAPVPGSATKRPTSTLQSFKDVRSRYLTPALQREVETALAKDKASPTRRAKTRTAAVERTPTVAARKQGVADASPAPSKPFGAATPTASSRSKSKRVPVSPAIAGLAKKAAAKKPAAKKSKAPPKVTTINLASMMSPTPTKPDEVVGIAARRAMARKESEDAVERSLFSEPAAKKTNRKRALA